MQCHWDGSYGKLNNGWGEYSFCTEWQTGFTKATVRLEFPGNTELSQSCYSGRSVEIAQYTERTIGWSESFDHFRTKDGVHDAHPVKFEVCDLANDPSGPVSQYAQETEFTDRWFSEYGRSYREIRRWPDWKMVRWGVEIMTVFVAGRGCKIILLRDSLGFVSLSFGIIYNETSRQPSRIAIISRSLCLD